ncbi:MAG: hypothetical protein HC827_15765 [Cyanobacteria bacterium RM1_2_2]|nr:hypothetical protein [Cyanobacteria bacterium RM1_2_2]
MLAQGSQLIPPPVLGTCVWGMMALFGWSLWAALREGIIRLKALHQIPCDRCMYCTGDYRLKCAVRPYTAFTEEAIGCRDFEPTEYAVPKRAKYGKD